MLSRVRKTTIRVGFDKDKASKLVTSLRNGARPITPVVQALSRALVERTRQTIRLQGLPENWKPLARNTIAAKGTSRIGNPSWIGSVHASVSGAQGQDEIFVLVPPEAHRLHTGTKPHVIKPKKGKFLVFRVAEEQSVFLKRQRRFRALRRGGSRVKIESRPRAVLVFAKKVNHPGTPKRSILTITNDFLQVAWRTPMRLFLFKGVVPK